MIERNLYNTFQKFLDQFPAVGVLGPRQVGKTTLAKAIAKNRESIYFDLERQSDWNKLRENPRFFLSQYKDRCVVIDEVQTYPELFKELRGLIDEDRRPGRFILLGSASPEIIRGTSETLAGRIGYLELTPFLISEIKEQRQLWIRGGFPDSFLTETDNQSYLWRESFISTFLQRDLALLGLDTNPMLMRRFWTMIASSQGSLLNAEKFAKSLGVSRTTIVRYIEFLEGAFVIRQLRPWSANLKKRLVKSPKVYLRDTGLVHALLGIENYENLLNHSIIGSSWEGFVVEQIANHLPSSYTPWFYRTHQGAECDLLIEKGGEVLYAIEIKLGENPKVSKGFRISMEDTGAKQGIIIGTGEGTYQLTETIMVTNLEDFISDSVKRA